MDGQVRTKVLFFEVGWRDFCFLSSACHSADLYCIIEINSVSLFTNQIQSTLNNSPS